MSRKLQIITTLFFAALLVSALASSAIAATGPVKIDSRVTLAQSDPFHGKVLSKKAACERNRTVEVYKVIAGPDGLFDVTKSDAQGEWSIAAGTPNGDFYAVAKQRSIDTNSTTLVCKKAVSPTVTF
jgi:hypothetical protein